MQNAFIHKGVSSLQKRLDKILYRCWKKCLLSKTYSAEGKSSFTVTLRSFVSRFWKETFKIRNDFTKWFIGSQLCLRKSVGVLTGDRHYTKFLKIRGYNFMIQFKMKEHFNSRENLAAQLGGKKKPNRKSHLLSLHTLPYKSSFLNPIPSYRGE